MNENLRYKISNVRYGSINKLLQKAPILNGAHKKSLIIMFEYCFN